MVNQSYIRLTFRVSRWVQTVTCYYLNIKVYHTELGKCRDIYRYLEIFLESSWPCKGGPGGESVHHPHVGR